MKTKLWGEIYKILPSGASVAIKKFVARILKLKIIVKNTKRRAKAETSMEATV
jgi:hypothetical protein